MKIQNENPTLVTQILLYIAFSILCKKLLITLQCTVEFASREYDFHFRISFIWVVSRLKSYLPLFPLLFDDFAQSGSYSILFFLKFLLTCLLC